MNEFQLIKKYFAPLSLNNKGSFNLTDDIFFDYKKKIGISVDTYIEKIHFLNFKKPDLVIKKILRASLSDLLCKGLHPKYYFISASGNKNHFTKSNLIKINKILKSEQKKFSIKISGGDTVLSNKLSFTIIVVGYAKNKPILRNNAKENDDIYVTNYLGDPYLGLKILQSKKKIQYYKYFVKSFFSTNIPYKFSQKLFLFANSSIDISDGLYQDLNHIMSNSKLNYKLFEKKIPISNKLKQYLNSKKLNKNNFISKGDDYQILFTANKNKKKLIKRIAKKTNTLVTKIGVVVRNKLKKAHKSQGYIHKFS